MSPASAALGASAPLGRKSYLDWLRGVSVLIMIQGHTLDSWTLVADRDRSLYRWFSLVWGMAAPIFLLLAGVALVLALGSRVRKGQSLAEATARARNRGWQLFGLALLFRLQSWIISGGELERTLLKVDILNVMALAILVTAVLAGLARDRWSRAAVLTVAAIAVAMLTPIVRAADILAALPDPIERYLRPAEGSTTFTLFPWAGFVLAGGAIGVWLDGMRTARQERFVNVALVPIGLAILAGGYAASFLPPIYEQTSFWTSSPTFFFVRLGILCSLLPLAYAWNSLGGRRSLLEEFGRASLFVYWIHVELLYGVLSTPLHRRLSLEQALVAWLAVSGLMFGAIRLKNRVGPWWRLSPGSKGLEPALVSAPEPSGAGK